MSRTIPPQLRRLVWEAYMPDSRSAYGPCFVCGNEIHITQFECGHVLSHANGGPISVENLRPICGSCNKSMGARNLMDYKAEFFALPRRNPPREKQSYPSSAPSKLETKKVNPKPRELKKKESTGFLGWLFGSSSTKEEEDDLEEAIKGFTKLSLHDSSSTCSHILLNGKRRGQACGRVAINGDRCENHTITNPCPATLGSGKRQGQICGKQVKTGKYCPRHSPR